MSYLQKYVRQVRPRNESYTPPVEKLQSFLTEGATTEATRTEMAICYQYNYFKEHKKYANIDDSEDMDISSTSGTTGKFNKFNSDAKKYLRKIENFSKRFLSII